MKNQVKKLISKLILQKEIKQVSVYRGRYSFEYYFDVDGYYQGSYFLIYAIKPLLGKPSFTISTNVSKNPENFKKFLETLTELKFTLE